MTPLTSALLEAASLAPSAHNTQPWQLRFGTDQLEIRADLTRSLPAADPDNRDLLHALGALVENCLLTLDQHGFAGEVRCAEQLVATQPVAVLRWQPSSRQPADTDLYRMIPIRRTSRAAYAQAPVEPGILQRLRAVVVAPFRLHMVTTATELAGLRQLAAAADLALMEQPEVCLELRRWLRFSPGDPAWYRDGLNAECMGWSRLEARIARHLINPPAVRMLGKLGLARPLLGSVDQQAPYSPAICLLTGPAGMSLAERVAGGRQLQRLWLTAAAAGLCTHPLSAAVDHAPSRAGTFGVFGCDVGQEHINLFRLGFSPPTPRSHRLPVDELLPDPVSGAETGRENPQIKHG